MEKNHFRGRVLYLLPRFISSKWSGAVESEWHRHNTGLGLERFSSRRVYDRMHPIRGKVHIPFLVINVETHFNSTIGHTQPAWRCIAGKYIFGNWRIGYACDFPGSPAIPSNREIHMVNSWIARIGGISFSRKMNNAMGYLPISRVDPQPTGF